MLNGNLAETNRCFRVLRGPVMNRFRCVCVCVCVREREREREREMASLDVFVLVGCGAPSTSVCYPTFCDNLPVSSSRVEMSTKK